MGRDFEDGKVLKHILDAILSSATEPVTIISDDSHGADSLSERYVTERGYQL